MEWFEALILGLVQGLTEYLPVSSSGHLTIGANIIGVSGEENLSFTVAVHVATVLSTCLILYKEIAFLIKDLFKFKWNEGTKYCLNIFISMIPIMVVGFFFKDAVEEIFGSGLLIVGICLTITALLLTFSYYAKPRVKEEISPLHAFIIGVVQAIAVLPGLSRSGSTIATGLILGNKKEKMAQFSFLMVIPPILGEALLNIIEIIKPSAEVVAASASAIPTSSIVIGFAAAFISGCLACKWMLNIVKKGKLVWFAIYCAIVGICAIAMA